VRWLFPGQVIRLDTRCLDCGDQISVTMQDEAILEIDPPSAVGYMMSPFTKWREGTKAFN
jgi:hypothetical protein